MEIVDINSKKENKALNSSLATLYLAFRRSLAKVSDQLKQNIAIKIGAYSYKYTDLDTVLSVLNPLLFENDLFVHQEYEKIGEVEYTKTTLCHISGKEKVFRTPFIHLETKGMNTAQALGASLTYMRRYALSSIFALATEENTDASNSVEVIKENKENKVQKEIKKVTKYTHYEYLLKFSKKNT